jgi:hypothetical protein
MANRPPAYGLSADYGRLPAYQVLLAKGLQRAPLLARITRIISKESGIPTERETRRHTGMMIEWFDVNLHALMPFLAPYEGRGTVLYRNGVEVPVNALRSFVAQETARQFHYHKTPDRQARLAPPAPRPVFAPPPPDPRFAGMYDDPVFAGMPRSLGPPKR